MVGRIRWVNESSPRIQKSPSMFGVPAPMVAIGRPRTLLLLKYAGQACMNRSRTMRRPRQEGCDGRRTHGLAAVVAAHQVADAHAHEDSGHREQHDHEERGLAQQRLDDEVGNNAHAHGDER